MENGFSNKLVFGKNNLPNVVSVEPLDNQCLIFQETNGVITQTNLPNINWLLAPKPLQNSTWKPLHGDLNYKYEANYQTRETFLKARQFYRQNDVYSIYDPKESFLVKSGVTYFKNMQIADVSVLSFDIETTGLQYGPKEKLLLVSNTYRSQGKITRKLFAYDEYDSQIAMIEDWCKWVREVNPSVILGHNILSFDLPYLNAIARYNDTKLYLGRDNSALEFAHYESKFRKDQTQFLSYHKAHIFGREIFDTYFAAIKKDIAEKKYDSYGLKPIIKVEGLEDKNRVFYDAGKIRYNYKIPQEWAKIKQYAETDADDALKLYDLFAPSYFYMTQSIPKSFQEVICSASGSQINSILVRGYFQEGHSISKATEVNEFQGGISLGIPGIYKNVWKVDIKSCYPSAILIKTLYDKKKDPQGLMYKLCEYFTKQRLVYKEEYKKTNNEYYKTLDASAKIFINSIFGFCSAAGLNFNSPEIAKQITASGREYLNMGTEWATGKHLDYWVQEAERLKNEKT